MTDTVADPGDAPDPIEALRQRDPSTLTRSERAVLARQAEREADAASRLSRSIAPVGGVGGESIKRRAKRIVRRGLDYVEGLFTGAVDGTNIDRNAALASVGRMAGVFSDASVTVTLKAVFEVRGFAKQARKIIDAAVAPLPSVTEHTTSPRSPSDGATGSPPGGVGEG